MSVPAFAVSVIAHTVYRFGHLAYPQRRRDHVAKAPWRHQPRETLCMLVDLGYDNHQATHDTMMTTSVGINGGFLAEVLFMRFMSKALFFVCGPSAGGQRRRTPPA